MKIATLLFCYNRSWHVGQVIDALRENTVLPQKLFVFQDGVKNKDDSHEWHKVNRLIRDIEWCEKEIIVSERNRGLSDSITGGIDYALKSYDAVIVLEDDCVPSPDFLSFMYQCLEKYQNTPEVYSVSGYAWPFSLPENGTDIYFCGRISSWGWGTWKDRWMSFEKDYTLLKRIRLDSEMAKELLIWGPDLEDMLLDNIRGKNDSWAVFWALSVILNRGICINPYKSLIQNIGHDGTGEHCGSTGIFAVQPDKRKNMLFRFPNIAEISDMERKAFRIFGESLKGRASEEKHAYYRACLEKWVKLKQSGISIVSALRNKMINRVVIYGMGSVAELLVKELSGAIDIVYILVTNRETDTFMGYKVYEYSEELPKETIMPVVIVIPGYDIKNIKKKIGTEFEEIYPLESLFEDIK